MFKGIAASFMCVVIILGISGCEQQCSSELIQSSRSGDGKAVIRLEKKNCGATTDFVYELKSVEQGSGNGILIFRFDSGQIADWPDDDRKILDLKWLSDSQLEVKLHEPVRIFYESRTISGVRVQYQYHAGTSRI
jgi:hypothetical protein